MHCCFSAVDMWVYVLDIQGRAGKHLEMTIKPSHTITMTFTHLPAIYCVMNLTQSTAYGKLI